MNTRRYPRTLVEAFGPYARWDIPEHRPFWRRHAWAFVLVLFASVTFLALIVEVR